MKKIVLAVGAIALVAALVFGATIAVSSASQASPEVPAKTLVAAHPADSVAIGWYIIIAEGLNPPYTLYQAWNYFYGSVHMTHIIAEWRYSPTEVYRWCNEYRHDNGWLGNWVYCGPQPPPD